MTWAIIKFVMKKRTSNTKKQQLYKGGRIVGTLLVVRVSVIN
jgi:hypothetical protein